jgi:hypothetical protein
MQTKVIAFDKDEARSSDSDIGAGLSLMRAAGNSHMDKHQIAKKRDSRR